MTPHNGLMEGDSMSGLFSASTAADVGQLVVMLMLAVILAHAAMTRGRAR